MTIKQQMCGLAVAVALLAGQAGAMTIDFASDTIGSKPNGWMSADSSLVTFTDSQGSALQIRDYEHQSHGKALSVGSDDSSYLIMDFAEDMGSLSLEFGNDDPGWIYPNDLAVLTAFWKGSQVGQVNVGVNANDYMDQSIGLGSIRFDRATFMYHPTLSTGLTEIVDNIQFERYETTGPDPVVPEPMTMLAVSASLVSLGGYVRRRRRSA
jgi:hypothetical protein